eukprot:10485189-Prorocentrum_lima.AAC.1
MRANGSGEGHGSHGAIQDNALSGTSSRQKKNNTRMAWRRFDHETGPTWSNIKRDNSQFQSLTTD